ncbi:MAG: protein-disulfide reductase DsbD family protein [Nevskiaceae bacterium]
MNTRAILALAALSVAAPCAAAPVATPHVEAELVAENTGWLAGATTWVALSLKPEPGWHTYWRNPGDSGLPTTLKWTLPAKWEAGEIAWPYPSMHKLGDLVNYGYDGQTLHLVPIEVPDGAEGDRTVKAQAKWLVCSDICIPGQAELSLTLPVAEVAAADPIWSPRFADTRARLPRPEPLRGIFKVVDGEMRLQVDAPELTGAQGVEFFAFAGDLVNHGASQRVDLDESVARFAQALSAYYGREPQTVEGVLVVRGSDATAYTVAATPGEVATVMRAPDGASAPAAEGRELNAPSLWLALGFALLGGLILNLMPCVFPVLSIKAVSVLESRRGDAAAERAHALAYTGGAVLSCVAVAAAILVLREGGRQLGWGFQLQAPVFVAFLAYLMLVLGLSLSGLVQFGTSLMGVGQDLVEQGGYGRSFFTGVLAVVVASPCTAPFMGTALGYALTQPPLVALLVFATLGLGLALPFLLLGFFPALGSWLPKPGRWMETFKQLMAFPLYLTVVWLLWVLGRQSGTDAVALVGAGLVLMAFALWLWGAPERAPLRAVLALAAAAGALALLAHPVITIPADRAATARVDGEPYSDARLAELRAQGRIVFVNFTADWCITCKVNEKVVFQNEDVRRVLAEKNVAWLTADWTTPDPAITAALMRFGRSGVPLYLLYPPEGEPEILPQVLTPGIVIEAVAWVSSLERK